MKLFLRYAVTIIFICGCFAPFAVSAQKAPPFSLRGNHKNIQLSKYKGRVVYVDFWASWCGPCRRSFPWMNKMQALYGKDKFSIIAINLDKSHAEAQQFLKKIHASFNIAYDPDGRIAEAYHLKVMPSSFLINKRGQVVYRSAGFNNEHKEKIENQIRRQLGRSMLASSEEN